MVIRYYTPSDYHMVRAWWENAKEIAPLEDMLPLDSTFIVELNNTPTLCVSLLLTNIREFCYVENFAGNPEVKGPERREAAAQLLKHLERFASAKGYKRLVCFAYKEPLKARYRELGFTQTLDTLASFCKSI